MNESDLLSLISAGENARVEFKSSMRFDIRLGKANKDLTKVVAKTVAGFFNTNGGILLIGVADNGEVLGIDNDIDTLSRKSIDYFEQAFRTAMGNYLGVDVSPKIGLKFVPVAENVVAVVQCDLHSDPVFLQDGDKREFYVRDGNSTRPLDVMAAHKYTGSHFRTPPKEEPDVVDIVSQVIDKLGLARVPRPPFSDNASSDPVTEEESSGGARSSVHYPPWIKVATKKVIDSFLKQLANSVGWKRINLVSPWISAFDAGATIRFETFLRRLVEDNTTLYLVTRPPVLSWHSDAVEKLAETGRANIAFVSNLHAKLYTASTSTGSFALLGSANFTHKSLTAEELGVLVNAFSGGKKVVRHLQDEANRIYRTPGRTLEYKAKFTF